ncbi:MAG: hypothetical protein IJU98_03400 [Synergistaceae bacterium]|nr:hypothetical protein [Synergistaceae bacterium]
MKKRSLSLAFVLLFILCLCPVALAEVLVPNEQLSKKLNDFVTAYLSPWKMSLWFDAVDSSVVEALNFQEAFKEVWSQQIPRLITDLKESDVAFDGDRSSYVSPSGEARHPGIHLKVAGRAWGDMLAISYSWNYTWAELKELLVEEVTSVPEVSRLFEALTIVFATTTGDAYAVVGAGGVAAAAANEKRALVVGESGTGISITLNVCLTNIWNRTAKQGPQFVENLLLVPDGAADDYITGTIWMVEKKASGSGSVSSNSGGGCNAGLGGMALMAAVFLRSRYKNGRGSSAVQGQAF